MLLLILHSGHIAQKTEVVTDNLHEAIAKEEQTVGNQRDVESGISPVHVEAVFYSLEEIVFGDFIDFGFASSISAFLEKC